MLEGGAVKKRERNDCEGHLYEYVLGTERGEDNTTTTTTKKRAQGCMEYEQVHKGSLPQNQDAAH